jgi:hypothetical protein
MQLRPNWRIDFLKKTSSYKNINILSRSMCDYRRGMDWCMNLLATYTHH